MTRLVLRRSHAPVLTMRDAVKRLAEGARGRVTYITLRRIMKLMGIDPGYPPQPAYVVLDAELRRIVEPCLVDVVETSRFKVYVADSACLKSL